MTQKEMSKSYNDNIIITCNKILNSSNQNPKDFRFELGSIIAQLINNETQKRAQEIQDAINNGIITTKDDLDFQVANLLRNLEN